MGTQAFGGGVTEAALHLSLATGDKLDVVLGSVRSVNISSRLHETTNFEGGHPWFDKVWGDPTTTIELRGITKTTFFTPAKQEKPVAKPKIPTVKASAELVRRVTVKHAQLTSKLAKVEALLTTLRREKELLDVELKASREQLLSVASSNGR